MDVLFLHRSLVPYPYRWDSEIEKNVNQKCQTILPIFFTADLFASKTGSRELSSADESAEDTYKPEKKKRKKKKLKKKGGGGGGGGVKKRKKKSPRRVTVHSTLIQSRTKTVTALPPSTSRVH